MAKTGSASSHTTTPAHEVADPAQVGDGAGGDRGLGATQAVIYVPGLGDHWFNRDPARIARQLAVALDRSHPVDQRFEVADAGGCDYGFEGAFRSPVHTVSRCTPQGEVPVVDFYVLDYGPTLTDRWRERRVAVKAAVVLGRLLEGLRRLLPASFRAVRTKGKGLSHLLQTAYLMAILAVLALYLVILVGALVGTTAEVFQRYVPDGEAAATADAESAPDRSDPGEATDSAVSSRPPPPELVGPALPAAWSDAVPGRLRDVAGSVLGALGGLVLGLWQAAAWVGGWVLALLAWAWRSATWVWGLGQPLWTSLALLGAAVVVFTRRYEQALENAATTLVCAWNYLSEGAERDAISGQLTALLQALGEREAPYADIHLLSYSFGSVAAMDALFPLDERPASGYGALRTFVTVGCPFDLLRTYFPHYFDGRTRLVDDDLQWVNVYCPHDVLGSNFRDDMELDDPLTGCGLATEETGPSTARPTTNRVFHAGTPAAGGAGAGGRRRMKLSSWLMLYGLRSHGLYWSADVDDYDALVLAVPPALLNATGAPAPHEPSSEVAPSPRHRSNGARRWAARSPATGAARPAARR
jgi:hypothetical protein